MGTPNYTLIEAVGELPQGAFVRPIHLRYLPKGWEAYVKGAQWFDPTTEAVCYTRLGLMILKTYQFRRV